jgi:hypothetical protein
MLSDKNLARIAGLFYLFVIATGLFAEVFVRQALRVPGDAMTTARNIQASAQLFRWGFVADLLNFIFGLPCVLIIYILLKSVNKWLATLALIFVIIQTAIIAINLLNQVTPLLYLENDVYLQSFSPQQLATLSLLSLNLQAQGYGIGLVFFGVYCLIVGYLIFKSRRLPAIIGILYAISGACYLINSFTMLLSANFSNPWFAYLAVPIFIGEMSLCLWLLIAGVKPGYEKLDI